MKKLFEEIEKINSISHEILKKNHECKKGVERLTKREKKQLKEFKSSMKLVLDQLSLFKAVFSLMLRDYKSEVKNEKV